MTLYAIYNGPAGDPAGADIRPRKFRWTAFLFTPVWLVVKRAWLMLGLWLVAAIAAGLVSAFLGDDAGFWLYVLVALWFGFDAATIEEAVMARRGRPLMATIAAESPDLALATWLRNEENLPRQTPTQAQTEATPFDRAPGEMPLTSPVADLPPESDK